MLQLGEADGKDLTSPARRDDQHRVKKRGKTKPAAPRSRYEARQYTYGDDEITAARNLSSRRQLGIPGGFARLERRLGSNSSTTRRGRWLILDVGKGAPGFNVGDERLWRSLTEGNTPSERALGGSKGTAARRGRMARQDDSCKFR